MSRRSLPEIPIDLPLHRYAADDIHILVALVQALRAILSAELSEGRELKFKVFHDTMRGFYHMWDVIEMELDYARDQENPRVGDRTLEDLTLFRSHVTPIMDLTRLHDYYLRENPDVPRRSGYFPDVPRNFSPYDTLKDIDKRLKDFLDVLMDRGVLQGETNFCNSKADHVR